MPSRTSPGPGPRRPPGCASPAGQRSRAGPRRAARPARSAHCAARRFPRRWTPPPVAAPDAGRTRTEATPAATAGPARAEDSRPRATLRPPAGDRPGERGRRRALHPVATDVEATIGGRGPARLRSSVLRIQFRWATAGTSADVPASLLSVSPAGRTPRRWRTIPPRLRGASPRAFAVQWRHVRLPPSRGGVPRDLSLIHISEPTRLGMISYAVFCLKKKKKTKTIKFSLYILP